MFVFCKYCLVYRQVIANVTELFIEVGEDIEESLVTNSVDLFVGQAVMLLELSVGFRKKLLCCDCGIGRFCLSDKRQLC